MQWMSLSVSFLLFLPSLFLPFTSLSLSLSLSSSTPSSALFSQWLASLRVIHLLQVTLQITNAHRANKYILLDTSDCVCVLLNLIIERVVTSRLCTPFRCTRLENTNAMCLLETTLSQTDKYNGQKGL